MSYNSDKKKSTHGHGHAVVFLVRAATSEKSDYEDDDTNHD